MEPPKSGFGQRRGTVHSQRTKFLDLVGSVFSGRPAGSDRQRGGEATIWDATSRKPLLGLKGHKKGVMSAVFSPNGRRIATASNDGTVKVWDAATGACLRTLNGHSDLVMSVCFSPDGQRILSSSRDQSARLWDVASGTELLTLKGHRGWVFTAVFSPDGRRIVTAGGDGTAKIWEAATVEQVETQLREHASEAAAVAEQQIKRWLVLLPIPFEGTNGLKPYKWSR